MEVIDMYPYILMIFVVIFYSGNILVGKGINELPPLTITFFRLFIAIIVLYPFGFRSAWQNRSTFLTHKKPFIIMGVTGILLFNTFIYISLQFTSSTNVSVLEAMVPAVTAILSFFILSERLRNIQWTGVLLSLLGALFVVMNGNIFQLTHVEWNIGDAIMIGAIFSWAIYSIMVKKYMHLFPSIGAIFAMTVISSLILIPFVIIEWIVIGIPSFETYQIVGLLYLGIFPSSIALIFYNRAVDLLSASRASVLMNFIPVITMFVAYLWMDETITIFKIIGTLSVIIGVMLTTRTQAKIKI